MSEGDSVYDRNVCPPEVLTSRMENLLIRATRRFTLNGGRYICERRQLRVDDAKALKDDILGDWLHPDETPTACRQKLRKRSRLDCANIVCLTVSHWSEGTATRTCSIRLHEPLRTENNFQSHYDSEISPAHLHSMPRQGLRVDESFYLDPLAQVP